MSFTYQSGISETPSENNQQNKVIKSKLYYLGHHKNRKSSTADCYNKEHLPISKQIDYIPEFFQVNQKKQGSELLEEIQLSRISRNNDDINNKTANHYYELIARQYQFAFERIQIALKNKEQEITKMKREYEIQISQKEQIIEELKYLYEQQLKSQDNNVFKLNDTIHRLQQKIKEQQITIITSKSQKEINQNNYKRLEKEYQQRIQKLQNNIHEFNNTMKSMNEMIDNKNQKISSLQKSQTREKLERSQLELQSNIFKYGQNNPQSANKNESLIDLVNKYKKQIQSLKNSQNNLQTKLQIQEHQLLELKQYKLSYTQSTNIIDNNVKMMNQMLGQIQQLKYSNKLLNQEFKKQENMARQQNVIIQKLKFENENLNSYNKVLSSNQNQRSKENMYSMSRLRNQTSLIATKFFS